MASGRPRLPSFSSFGRSRRHGGVGNAQTSWCTPSRGAGARTFLTTVCGGAGHLSGSSKGSPTVPNASSPCNVRSKCNGWNGGPRELSLERSRRTKHGNGDYAGLTCPRAHEKERSGGIGDGYAAGFGGHRYAVTMSRTCTVDGVHDGARSVREGRLSCNVTPTGYN